MAQAINTAQAIQDAAQRFEAYAVRVTSIAGTRALEWAALVKQARAIGLDPVQIAPDLAAANAQATANAANWQRWVNELAAGRAELVPYQVDNEPIRIGVRRTESGSMHGLGFWPVVGTVVQYVGRAALAVGTWWSLDAWQDTRAIEVEAQRTDAQTRASLAQAAQSDPALARQIVGAMDRASGAAEDAGPDWIDRLTNAATGAAAGLSSGLLILAALYWYSQRSKKGSR